jgi:CcmD family protein
MTDAMKVMVVILVVWVGLFLYLLKLDRDVARLTREVRKPYWNPKPTLSDPERMRKPGRVPGDAEKAETK